jgi:biopolymer transport protein ExbD
MATLQTKIKLYAEANSVANVDFDKQVILKDDGDGVVYIDKWNIDSLAKPTDEQLATYNSAATTEENNNVIRGTRKSAYGDIGDQLDEIYKDIDAWKARIKSIKDANPKE